MSTLATHACPRCASRFGRQAELEEHLETDHGVSLYPPWDQSHSNGASSAWGRIAVPVNPLQTMSRAVSVAAVVAEQARMGVDIVGVSPPGVGAGMTEDHLRSRALDAKDMGASVATWHRLEGEDVTKAILAFVADSDATMLCMDSHSRGALAEFALGSISSDLVRRSPVPVLLVGPRVGGQTATTTMVVAVDQSDPAAAAVDAAASMAARLSADLVLVHVRDPDGEPHDGDRPRRSTVDGDLPTSGPPAGDQLGEDHLRRMASRLPTSRTRSLVLPGCDPAQVIVDVADGIPDSMIVMGTHGRSGLQRLTRGSVTRDVVRTARCPVLVVGRAWEGPPPDRQIPM